MSQEEIATEAIKHALKALRRRHLVEEGAHAPAIIALSKPILHQGSEWKEKAENLEMELQQCYKAQSRLSEQLVVEVAECRASKASLQEKEAAVADLQKELTEKRDECSQLAADLEEKIKALELVVNENKEIRAQLEAISIRARNAETESKVLIDRWMLEKMKDAERLNEANALYEDMIERLRASGLEKLARQQVDGVVRQSEEGAEYYVESTIPSACKNRIPAHEGGCASILFEYNSGRLITGGQDGSIKMWDTNNGSLTHTLHGCIGSVLDLTITHDNKSIIAASSSNKLYAWDVSSGRVYIPCCVSFDQRTHSARKISEILEALKGKPQRKMIRTRLVWFGVGFSLTGAAISHLVWKALLVDRFALSSDVKQKFDALEGRIVNLERSLSPDPNHHPAQVED